MKDLDMMPVVIGLSLVMAVLLALLVLTVRGYRRKLKSMEISKEIDRTTGVGNLEYMRRCFDKMLNDKNRTAYAMFYFYVDTERMERRSGRAETKEFLLYMASVLQEQASDADILARTGEHGFALLRRCEGREEVRDWFRPILPRVYGFAQEEGITAELSAGVYCLRDDDRDLNTLIFNAGQTAQIAYRAKEAYMVCTDEVLRGFEEDLHLRGEIRRGLDREEFQLYVQCYVDTHTHQIVGGEALSRWDHPKRGRLYPDRYVPLMEQENLIDQLDYYTLDKVCRLLEALQRIGVEDFFISCNFSRGTFAAEDFARKCEAVMEKYNFRRELLVFELTESCDVKNTNALKQNIKAVKALGIRIALDDFGEGFTSFFDIQEYPLDVLKLDKGLIDNLGTDPGDVILQAMIWAGHKLGITVLAEGVENDDQVRMLQEMSCDVIQGFRFHYPIPARELWEKMRLSGELSG